MVKGRFLFFDNQYLSTKNQKAAFQSIYGNTFVSQRNLGKLNNNALRYTCYPPPKYVDCLYDYFINYTEKLNIELSEFFDVLV